MSYIGKTPTAVPLTSSDITDGIITTAKIVDANITTAKILDANITTAKIADDAVTTDKLANSINSAITANTAKVTNATHSGDVTGATALTIADNAVTLAKMASGTDGNIISYDASGNPVAVATGSAGQVLTSAGAGSPPTFAAVASNAGTLAMRAETTSDLSVSGNTQTEIVLQSAAVDIGSKYNSSNGRYTPGVAGRYFVSYAFSCINGEERAGSEPVYVKIRVNGGGAEIGQGGQGGMDNSGQMLLSGSGIAVIGNSSSYISIWMFVTGNGITLANDQVTWNVFRLD